MPSAPYYVHERLQQVLSHAVKNNQQYVLYRNLPRLIRKTVLRSTVTPMSPYRSAVRDAVVEEMLLGHVVLNIQYASPRLYLTPDGAYFFAHFAPIPAGYHGAAAPNPTNGPLRQPAIDEYVALAAIVRSIQTTLRSFDPVDSDTHFVKRLPQAIRSYLESQQKLRADNSSLVVRLNDLTREVDEFCVQLNEMTATETDVSAQDQDDIVYDSEVALTAYEGSHSSREGSIIIDDDLYEYETGSDSEYEGSLMYPEDDDADVELMYPGSRAPGEADPVAYSGSFERRSPAGDDSSELEYADLPDV